MFEILWASLSLHLYVVSLKERVERDHRRRIFASLYTIIKKTKGVIYFIWGKINPTDTDTKWTQSLTIICMKILTSLQCKTCSLIIYGWEAGVRPDFLANYKLVTSIFPHLIKIQNFQLLSWFGGFHCCLKWKRSCCSYSLLPKNRRIKWCSVI